MGFTVSPIDLMALRDYALFGDEEDAKFVKGVYRKIAWKDFVDSVDSLFDNVTDSVGAVGEVVPL